MGFDPYHTWLGISPEERPADHYRLLGLQRFESDRTVIAHALEQRVAALREVQSGPRGAHSQPLLNEVAAAGRVLLDDAKRAAYDQQLRARAAAARPATWPGAPLPGAPVPGAQVPGHAAPVAARPVTWAPPHPATSPPPPSVASRPALPPAPTMAPVPVWPAAPPPTPVPDLAPPSTSRRGVRRNTLAMWVFAAGLPLLLLACGLALGWRLRNRAARTANDNDKVVSHADPDAKVGPDTRVVPATGATTPDATTPDATTPDSTRTDTTTPTPTPPTPTTPTPTPPTPTPTGPTIAAGMARAPAPPATRHALRLIPGETVELLDSDDVLDWEHPFTVEAWVRPRNLLAPGATRREWTLVGNRETEVATGAALGWAFGGVESPDATTWRLQRGSSWVGMSLPRTEPAPADSTWTHWALQYSPNPRAVTWFVDGHGETSTDLTLEDTPSLASNLRLGTAAPATGEGWQGDIGGLRITDGLVYRGDFTPSWTWQASAETRVLLDFDRTVTGKIVDVARGHDAIVDAGRWIAAAGDTRWDAEPADRPPAGPPGDATTPGDMASPGGETPANAPQPLARLPVPSAIEVQEAKQRVEQSIQDEGGETAIATCLQIGRRVEETPAIRFAILQHALDLAKKRGALPLGFEACDEIERVFDFDALAWRIELLEATAKLNPSPTKQISLVDHARRALELAVQREDFPHALRAYQLALSMAERLRNNSLIRDLRAQATEVGKARRRWEEASAARDAIATNPSDARARHVWGRYLAEVRGDWPEALRQLSECDSEALRAATAQDLANPVRIADELACADRWWDLARAPDIEKEDVALFEARAKYWYQLVREGVVGLERARVLKCLQQSESIVSGPPEVRDRLMLAPAAPAGSLRAEGGVSLLDGAAAPTLALLDGVAQPSTGELRMLLVVNRIAGDGPLEVSLNFGAERCLVVIDGPAAPGSLATRRTGLAGADSQAPAQDGELLRRGRATRLLWTLNSRGLELRWEAPALESEKASPASAPPQGRVLWRTIPGKSLPAPWSSLPPDAISIGARDATFELARIGAE